MARLRLITFVSTLIFPLLHTLPRVMLSFKIPLAGWHWPVHILAVFLRGLVFLGRGEGVC